MYIFKNAFKNISRSLGRNILIGIIVTVIAAASCVALSIRKSSEKARETNMESLNITAHINVDRAYVMEGMQNSNVDMTERLGRFEVNINSSLNNLYKQLILEEGSLIYFGKLNQIFHPHLNYLYYLI